MRFLNDIPCKGNITNKWKNVQIYKDENTINKSNKKYKHKT